MARFASWSGLAELGGGVGQSIAWTRPPPTSGGFRPAAPFWISLMVGDTFAVVMMRPARQSNGARQDCLGKQRVVCSLRSTGLSHYHSAEDESSEILRDIGMYAESWRSDHLALHHGHEGAKPQATKKRSSKFPPNLTKKRCQSQSPPHILYISTCSDDIIS